MPGPTPDEFATIVAGAASLDNIVRDVLFAGVPFVFEAEPNDWDVLRAQLASDLDADYEGVVVVGSAKMGYSLAPRKYGVAFSSDSDIDVIVVNEELYDRIWLSVIGWHYRRRHRLPPADRAWDAARREDLYWGYLNPVGFTYRGLSRSRQLDPARNVSTVWFNAFQRLGRLHAFAGRRVSGRLYRSWDHAVGYHSHGLRELRRKLEST